MTSEILHGGAGIICTPVPDIQSDNKGLPKSAKQVLSVLRDGESRTFADLEDEVEIAPRTLRFALKRLNESGFLIRKLDLKDGRRIVYQLAGQVI